MHDWQAVVRERFSGLGLTDDQQREVITELAAHLEDLYVEQCALGVNEAQAMHQALDDGTDWRQLERRIRHSKHQEENMNTRTRTLWLPGLASLTAAMGMLMVMNRIGIEPKIYWYRSMAGLELYLPWLMTLPVFGALGAYLSRRAQGELKTRLAAALFPSIVVLGLFCLGIALSVVVAVFQTAIERHVNWQVVPVAFALMVVNWVLLPGAALALGALPFLRNSGMRLPEERSAN